MFELIRVFPTHASPYVGGYVNFDRQYTVGEFIEEALEKYPAISGSFPVVCNFTRCILPGRRAVE